LRQNAQTEFEKSAPISEGSNDMESEQLTATTQPQSDTATPRSGSRFGRVFQVIGEEIGFGRGSSNWTFVRMLLGLFPSGAFSRTRVLILRIWGLRIGKGSTIAGTPVLAGSADPRKSLIIGERCFINWPVHLDVSAPITIGDRASIGHHVVIITTDHEIGSSQARAARQLRRPVTIGAGVWIGSSVIVLPGVTIGEGAVVGAGALVNKDVAPNTVVGGVPARVIRHLD
jgi:maltose O-acetyltransferase